MPRHIAPAVAPARIGWRSWPGPDPAEEAATRIQLQAFGLRLITEIALPGRWRTPTALSDRLLEIRLDPSVPEAFPDSTLEWAAPIDGAWFTLERRGDGAVLFRHETGRHLLSPDARSLRCAPRDERDPAWFRVLLARCCFAPPCSAARRGFTPVP